MRKKLGLLSLSLIGLLSACGGGGGGDGPDPGDPSVPTPPGDDPSGPSGPTDPSGPVATSRFFLFSGEEVRNTTNPRIETDAGGGVHVVYPAYAVGDAFYAYCPSNCSSEDQASVVELPTEGTVVNAMLALDTDGTPHVLLSTYLAVYYATCSGDCRQQSAWSVDSVLEHGGEFEVSGEAFALDPQGRPRFLMHPYRSLAGSAAGAYLVACEADCSRAASWSSSQVSTQRWQESSLRYGADGTAHVATTATLETDGDATAYLTCSADCDSEAGWNGVALYKAFSDPYVSNIYPVASLALTDDGRPRMLAIGADDAGGGQLIYYECDTGCTDGGDNWLLNVLIGSDAGNALGAGLDLTLDAADHPRLAYTANENILAASCDERCGEGGEGWSVAPVEMSADIPVDEIIPYYNCTVAAWFLREPSIAIGADGSPRVAYRAEDISGSLGSPDPNYPTCNTGADMTLTRFAQIAG